ncbi:peptide chain release factor N(5)-glutamine methyltransferase [Candidatus Nomurabacteria bacterium]|nr:peptide chain release factor N(5)-glutamine methyltransferase [Candidatus Nomurabacteria bacterium]USN94986.1 MAG: peptide chain release factor N(5)-glutamine methyltransferase [Candidatus Nomurabacteria bacterium]
MKDNLKQEIAWLLRDKYNGIVGEEFEQDTKRLEKGEPLAYVIGWVPFSGTQIYLDSKPLIPRPETEFLVETISKNIPQEKSSVLDLCAGSGCIGIALAKKFPSTNIDFAEIDENHHKTIQKNLKENQIQNKTNIFGGNLFENIDKKYDIIVTNPPYIDSSLDRVPDSVLNYEPHIALFGGKQGMEIIEKILNEYKNYLNDGGILYLEHEPEQTEIISRFSGFEKTIKDQFDVDRFSIFRK